MPPDVPADMPSNPGATDSFPHAAARGDAPHEWRSETAAATPGSRGVLERYYDWRNGLLADPDFHRKARRNPLLRFVARRRARAMFDLCSGFVYSQVLSACVQLKLFDCLAVRPLSRDQVADALELDAEACEVLLRSATSLKLVQQRAGGLYGLGIHGAAFLANPGIATMVEHHAFLYRDLTDPVALLKREGGETLLSLFWDYDGARREQGADDAGGAGPYTALMSASQQMIAEQIVDCYPVSSHQCLLDVGGGDGTFLRTVAKSAPDLELKLFDLPPVAATARRRFAEAGTPNATECTGGSVFEDALPTGADLLSLVRVVHDHDDAEALALLRRCREALPSGGTLLLAEPMSRERIGDRATDAYFGFYLQAMGRGRPRTATELSSLLGEAGFRRVREARTQMPMLTSLLVARAG